MTASRTDGPDPARLSVESLPVMSSTAMPLAPPAAMSVEMSTEIPVSLPVFASAQLVWLNEMACLAFAQRLARSPSLGNAYITLYGDLGAGKTTLVRHLLRALGVAGRIKSPTYAVVEPHEGRDGLSIWHFDFYRFADPQEWEDAGFRDVFASPGLKLAEWPQKSAGLAPSADLAVYITAAPAPNTPQDDSPPRHVRLVAHSACGQDMLQHCTP